ncbi:unnamed protein product [Gadus morhua 'NCC']
MLPDSDAELCPLRLYFLNTLFTAFFFLGRVWTGADSASQTIISQNIIIMYPFKIIPVCMCTSACMCVCLYAYVCACLRALEFLKARTLPSERRCKWLQVTVPRIDGRNDSNAVCVVRRGWRDDCRTVQCSGCSLLELQAGCFTSNYPAREEDLWSGKHLDAWPLHGRVCVCVCLCVCLEDGVGLLFLYHQWLFLSFPFFLPFELIPYSQKAKLCTQPSEGARLLTIRTHTHTHAHMPPRTRSH